MFLNPWKKMRDFPKIINLDGNGNMASKLVPKDDLVNMKTIEESITKTNTPDSNDLLLRKIFMIPFRTPLA